jgi:hypothetical protein
MIAHATESVSFGLAELIALLVVVATLASAVAIAINLNRRNR